MTTEIEKSDTYVQTYPKKLTNESSYFSFHVESTLQRLHIYYEMFASSPCLIAETNLRIHKLERTCRLTIMHQRVSLIISTYCNNCIYSFIVCVGRNRFNCESKNIQLLVHS